MARICTAVGGLLVVLGIAMALTFAVAIMRDDGYSSAALAAARNPGNVMYDAELKGAQVKRAFELVGSCLGVLLALNGGTLVALGVVASRHSKSSSTT